MHADNSNHLAEAARRRSKDTMAKAHEVVSELEAAGEKATITAVAARAGVSRAWLYTQPELRRRIDALRQNATQGPRPARGEPASDASLRQRLALAHQRIQQLSSDNEHLREQLANLHGQLRTARLSKPPVADTVHDTNNQARTHSTGAHRR